MVSHAEVNILLAPIDENMEKLIGWKVSVRVIYSHLDLHEILPQNLPNINFP